MWQHLPLSEQIRSEDTPACCWDVKQPSNTKYHWSMTDDSDGVSDEDNDDFTETNDIEATCCVTANVEPCMKASVLSFRSLSSAIPTSLPQAHSPE